MTDEIERPTIQALYREHFAFVWRTLRRLGVTEHALDDAAQDVFVVVHRRLDDFQPGAAPKPWLFGIALRVARQRRRKSYQERASQGFDEQVHGTSSSDPHQAALQAEADRFVQRFLATLDVDKRAVFILADLEQMSGPEIAQTLDVNLNTVYARLRAARQQLIDMVNKERATARRASHA